MATISDLYNDLVSQCNKSEKCINEVCTSEYSTEEKKDLQDLVIRQAFLCVFTEWEHFLENTTIEYILGEPSKNGGYPTRYVFPRDFYHADKIIRGTGAYPDWSKMDVVKELEESLFKNGDPYLSALNGISSKYKDMQKVRNHIVHNSVKSGSNFDSLVRTALSAGRVGISPTEFLISKKNRNTPRFFEQYIGYIRIAAQQIAEFVPLIDTDDFIEETT